MGNNKNTINPASNGRVRCLIEKVFLQQLPGIFGKGSRIITALCNEVQHEDGAARVASTGAGDIGDSAFAGRNGAGHDDAGIVGQSIAGERLVGRVVLDETEHVGPEQTIGFHVKTSLKKVLQPFAGTSIIMNQ